jgi:hypothetical protein
VIEGNTSLLFIGALDDGHCDVVYAKKEKWLGIFGTVL